MARLPKVAPCNLGKHPRYLATVGYRAFEITQKLDLIVLSAIGHILGIKASSKRTYYTVVTTNSRAIKNIIKYYHNTMKGIKSFEYRVWSGCYIKHKGDFAKLNEIRNRIRSRKIRGKHPRYLATVGYRAYLVKVLTLSSF